MPDRAMQRKTVAGATRFADSVGERQVRVVASDNTKDRVGDILEPMGCVADAYRRNPVVLFGHDQMQPIARCAVDVTASAVTALIDFPPPGTSNKSDEVLRLLKAGILGAVSVGFIPITWEPIKGGGYRYTSWELIELSVVAVPANPSALVTAKGIGRHHDDPTLAATLAEIAAVRAEAQAPRQRRQVEAEQSIGELRAELRQARRDAGYVRSDVLVARTAYRMGRI